MGTQVLDHQAVCSKISRIAWQIFEEFSNEKEIVIAGIADRGYLFASLLKDELDKISDLSCSLHKLSINKDEPLDSQPILDPSIKDFTNANVVLVDDVLKSGSTLIYGVRYFLNFPIKIMKTVVLVDRNHKRYPVKADFKGISLSTSLQEHVNVFIINKPFSVEVS
jgi:pyrimidine operon attenuation protein/uracil phosphoribosyltransferase